MISLIGSAGYGRGYGVKNTSRVLSRRPRLRSSSSVSRTPSMGEGGHLMTGVACPSTIVPPWNASSFAQSFSAWAMLEW